MQIKRKTKKDASAIRLACTNGKREVARAYLYILRHDLHKEPFGFLEDVFVEERYRGKGLGTKLVRAATKEAKKRGCYKLIGTSRAERTDVHRFYANLGMKKYGLEFRRNLE
jgi:GNAT superfamily N-acetyltransferase